MPRTRNDATPALPSTLPTKPGPESWLPAVSRRSILQLGAAGAAAAGLLSMGGPGAVAAPPVVARAGTVLDRRAVAALDHTVLGPGWRAQPFRMADVRIGAGVFSRAADQNLELARAYPVDRVLAVFRRNAGLDTKGASAPGGWEGFGHPNEQAWGPTDYPGRAGVQTENLLRGHYAGHFLSMVALAFASTGESALKDKADAIVAGLGEVQQTLAATGRYSHPGFLAAYGEWQFSQLERYAPYGEIWAPYYTAHKIFAGLLDAYQLCGNEQALTIATSMGRWVHARLSVLPNEQRQRMWGIYIAGEYGGMNEVLAELAALTGDDTFLATAKLFDLDVLVDASADGVDILNGRHANQHIPQFPGYAKVFDHTGETRYLDAVRNFWGMVVPGRTYAHGGNGEGELWGPANTVAGDIGARNAETCASYNMLKTSRLLFFHTLDARYMDYYERAVLNHVLGSRKNVSSTTSPEVAYMYQVQPGGRREYGNTGTCCGGTGLENHVKYNDSIYFRSPAAASRRELWVNLYLPSTLEWEDAGLTLVQETDYPRQQGTRLRVSGGGALDLHLRVPGWVRRGFTVKVNGQVQQLDARPATYVTVSRTWATGDVVDVEMPFSLRAVPTVDDPGLQSLEWGPTVLLVRGTATRTPEVGLYGSAALDGSLDRAITPTGGGYFTLGGATLEPAWSGDDTQYSMYIRRTEPRIVFAGTDSGAKNPARPDGTTFLDALWGDGGFASRTDFLAGVRRTVDAFSAEGLLSRRDAQRTLLAAGKARFA